jgi:hypothetical protein
VTSGANKPQIQPCIFVGYPDGVKGYQLLDLEIHDLFIERSVQFEESSSSSSSHLPFSTTDSDNDSKEFPPSVSTQIVYHEVLSSSS